VFASATLWRHLARGAIGLTLLAVAVGLAPTHPALALPALAGGLIALRGCPLCWTVGLAQTAIATVTRRRVRGACLDGSCALARRPRP
jgi:hypothetical protein